MANPENTANPVPAKSVLKPSLRDRLSAKAKSIVLSDEAVTAIAGVQHLLDTYSKEGIEVFPLCEEKNCATVGYLIFSVKAYLEKTKTAGIIIWKVGSKEAIAGAIEECGADFIE